MNIRNKVCRMGEYEDKIVLVYWFLLFCMLGAIKNIYGFVKNVRKQLIAVEWNIFVVDWKNCILNLPL